MPTERFVKLNKEKKKRISEAVMNEFQRTSYGELQISKIARAARISRGSLYTYFKDKEDMFLFALSQTWQNVLEQNQNRLLEYGGDFWEMQLSSLALHFQICKSNQIYRLLYLASENEAIPCEPFFWKWKDSKYQEHKKWIYLHMNKSSFRDWTEEELDILQDTCQSLLMVSIQRYLLNINGEEKIKEDFRRKLMQIKKAYVIE